MTASIICPHCGYSKTIPSQQLPPEGTPGTCPNCAQMFYVSPQTVVLQQETTHEKQSIAEGNTDKPVVVTEVSFTTFTKRDNRFTGKGNLLIDAHSIVVEGRKNGLFSGGRVTERYPLNSVRNVSREGKIVRFVIPLEKGQWKALIACHELAEAEKLVHALPDHIDSTFFTVEQANQELKDRMSQLPEGSPVVWTLIALNILIYLAVAYTGKQWFSFNADYLAASGGNFSPLTTEGQWWRMLTATFLHGGLIHLALNMYALYSFGIMAERLYCSRAFLGIYLIAGLSGSAGTLLFSPAAVGVGASGAIFGIMGLMIAFLATDKTFLSQGARKQLLINFCIFGGYSLLQGFKHTGIDNAAHIGGLLTGLLLGWLTGEPLRLRKETTEWFSNRVMAGIAVVLLATGAAAASSPRLGADYKAHQTMNQVLRELMDREKQLGTYLKQQNASGKTEVSAQDDLKVFAQRMKATYQGLPQRVEPVQPNVQKLKARKEALYTYLKNKSDAADMYLQAADKNDESLAIAARKKVNAANELIKELQKPAEWY